MPDNWNNTGGMTWRRADGVTVYAPGRRSYYRAHRLVGPARDVEDLKAENGKAATFRYPMDAMDAADAAWPLNNGQATNGKES